MTIDCDYIYKLLLEEADLCEKSNNYYKTKWAKIYSYKDIIPDDFKELYKYLKRKLSNNLNFIFRIRSSMYNNNVIANFYIKPIEYMKYIKEEHNILYWDSIKRKTSNEKVIELRVMKYNLIKYKNYKKAVRRLNEYLYHNNIYEIDKTNNKIFIYSKKI